MGSLWFLKINKNISNLMELKLSLKKVCVINLVLTVPLKGETKYCSNALREHYLKISESPM